MDRSAVAAQPRGVFVLCSTELAERFSYYGMLGLLVFFLSASPEHGGVGWSETLALRVVGGVLAATWFAPLVGGWVADRFIGAHAAIILGCLCLALGNLLLASRVLLPLMGPLWLGLLLIVAGSGLLKSNAAVLLGRLFSRTDPNRDVAFTLFYMGINLGALLAPLVAGTLGQRVGWHWGFLSAAVGMALGLAVFALQSRTLTGTELGTAPHGAGLGSKTTKASDPDRAAQRRNLIVIGVFIAFGTIFASGLMQFGGLLNLFAHHRLDRHVGSFEIPETWFLALNPALIIVAGPLVAQYWARRRERHPGTSPADQFIVGLLLAAAAFGTLTLLSSTTVPSHWLWFVAFYSALTLAELCIHPVGLSLVSNLAPPRIAGLVVGSWLLTNAIGSWIAAELGVLAQQTDYAIAFAINATAAAGGALALRVIRPWLIALLAARP